MGDREPSRADGDLCGSTSISEPFRCVTMAWPPCDLRHWSVIAAGSTSKSRIRRGPMMHGTIGSIKGCGRRLHDRPGEKRPVPGVLAAVGFFLLIFGSTSIGMGSAIVLSGAIGTSGPARETDVAVHNNDGYLEEYARGPGRGWFVLGQAPCLPEKTAHISSLRAIS